MNANFLAPKYFYITGLAIPTIGILIFTWLFFQALEANNVTALVFLSAFNAFITFWLANYLRRNIYIKSAAHGKLIIASLFFEMTLSPEDRYSVKKAWMSNKLYYFLYEGRKFYFLSLYDNLETLTPPNDSSSPIH